MIEGEPGIGKTSLWLAAVAQASVACVARPRRAAERSRGDVRLCQPWRPARVGPRRRPRRTPAGPANGEPSAWPCCATSRWAGATEALAIAVAFLNLLGVLAKDQRLLVAVDDIQWLDQASALALGFAIRRIGDNPIWFLLAHRVEAGADTPPVLDRALADVSHERIAVGPLGPEVLHRLLEMRLGPAFDHATVRAIHATSGGNPLFAIGDRARDAGEVGKSRHRRGAADPRRPHGSVTARVASMPGETQDALAVAAALASPTLELISRATGRAAEHAPGAGA